MKFLIVNGDDFGASRGINRGIMDAHRCGILTSASLLVNEPWSEHAATLGRAARELSVGLHVSLRKQRTRATAQSESILRDGLRRQFDRFAELMGRPPSHLDSHHNVHRHPEKLPVFFALAEEHDIPLREHSAVRYFPRFYGQWGRQTHLEQIGVESLTRMLAVEIEAGVTELSCHPGNLDAEHVSGYYVEREAELSTLCHPAIREVLAAQSIQLTNYHHLSRLVVNAWKGDTCHYLPSLSLLQAGCDAEARRDRSAGFGRKKVVAGATGAPL